MYIYLNIYSLNHGDNGVAVLTSEKNGNKPTEQINTNYISRNCHGK